MQETLKMMKQIIIGNENERSLQDLITAYKINKSPNILAYFYVNNFGLILKVCNKYKNIVDEDKASYALQELDKCMLTYDETVSNFSTFFSTYLDNALITLSIKKSTDKRKIMYNEENIDSINLIDLGYEDNYNCFDIDTFCKDNNLSNSESKQCKLLYNGYNIKEIAKKLNTSVQYCYQLNKNIKNKLLNLV